MAPQDRWPAGRPDGLSVARVTGAATITDNHPLEQLLAPADQPGAAFDGSPTSAWRPAKPYPGRWLQVGFAAPHTIRSVAVTSAGTVGRRIGSITVDTDGTSRTVAIGPDGTAAVRVTSGPTTFVRITVASLIDGADIAKPGLTEVKLGGADVGRTLVTAGTGRDGQRTGADVVALDRSRRDRYDSSRADEDAILDRTFTLGAEGLRAVRGEATSIPGSALDALLATVTPAADTRSLRTSASSQWHDQPTFDPAAAFDGDPATAWISDPEVTAPRLRVAWTGPIDVSTLTVRTAPASDPVDEVAVIIDGRRVVRSLPESGVITILSVRTDHLELAFSPSGPSSQGTRAAVAEISVEGLDGRTAPRPDRSEALAVACGNGPGVQIDGQTVPTSARVSVAALLDGSPVEWEACDRVRLSKGDHHLVALDSAPLAVATTLIAPSTPLPASRPARPVRVQNWDTGQRRVRIGAGAQAIVATTENFNDGWRATLVGRPLPTIRVDGWRQG